MQLTRPKDESESLRHVTRGKLNFSKEEVFDLLLCYIVTINVSITEGVQCGCIKVLFQITCNYAITTKMTAAQYYSSLQIFLEKLLTVTNQL